MKCRDRLRSSASGPLQALASGSTFIMLLDACCVNCCNCSDVPLFSTGMKNVQPVIAQQIQLD